MMGGTCRWNTDLTGNRIRGQTSGDRRRRRRPARSCFQSERTVEGLAQGHVLGAGQQGVATEKLGSVISSLFEQVEIAKQIGHFEGGDSVLARSEKFAGASETEVLVGD